MKYFVYILKSEQDSRFYIGQTQNLEKRVSYHNEGRSKYTRSYTPWILLYSKHCKSRSQAMKLEKKLKSLKSRDDVIRYTINHDFTKH